MFGEPEDLAAGVEGDSGILVIRASGTNRGWNVIACIAAFAVACGKGAESPSDSVAIVPPTAAVSQQTAPDSPSARPGSPCRHTGSWGACTIERRLKQAGFVVKRLEEKPVKRPGFSVEPIVYALGSSRLEAFIYSDESSLAEDLALIDTVTVAPKGTPSTWESTPILIRSANLVVVLLTQNPRQAERAMLAITAGAPQPGSPR